MCFLLLSPCSSLYIRRVPTAPTPKVAPEEEGVKRLQAKVETLKQMAQLTKGEQKKKVEKKLFAALSRLSTLLSHDSDDDSDGEELDDDEAL
jgi:hypothetical protein